MKALQKLFDECDRMSHDMFGFVHYIPKEVIDDARREFEELQRHLAKRSKQGDLPS